MDTFRITAKIPKPVEEVFEYITTPENFPKWKKDVWIAGRKYGRMGPGFRMIQTVYLMSPRQFMMHVTGYEQNRYFKFEALKGFVILPGWSFYFETCSEGTFLSAGSQINLAGKSVRGMLYPLGLTWHWKTYFELLSYELFNKPGKVKTVSFEYPDENENIK
jgi:hypothetical protein